MLKDGTICDKHEKIFKLLSDIESLVDKAKSDGQRMENGLDDKRKRIDELEAENEGLKDEIRTAEKIIQDLEEQIAEMKATA